MSVQIRTQHPWEALLLNNYLIHSEKTDKKVIPKTASRALLLAIKKLEMQFKKLTLKRGLRDRVECTFYALQFAGFPLYTKLLVHIYDNYSTYTYRVSRFLGANIFFHNNKIIFSLFHSLTSSRIPLKDLVYRRAEYPSRT